MAQTAAQALAAAELYSDDLIYRFITLPQNAITVAAGIVAEAGQPFTAMLVDKDEVTLMLEQEHYDYFQKRLRDHEVSDVLYRLITFDIVLESSMVGFIAPIATALAQANISIMPFAAYSRDHLFVAASDYERAITLLRALQLENTSG